MNKSQSADRLAERMGLSKSAAAAAVDAVFETIGEALAEDEDVRIAGFGTFTTKSRPARAGRNPRTGEAAKRYRYRPRRRLCSRRARRSRMP